MLPNIFYKSTVFNRRILVQRLAKNWSTNQENVQYLAPRNTNYKTYLHFNLWDYIFQIIKQEFFPYSSQYAHVSC